MAVNDRIRDALLDNEILVARTERAIQRDVLRLLTELRQELTTLIAESDPTTAGVRLSTKQRRWRALLNESINPAIQETYSRINAVTTNAATDVAEVTAIQTTRGINESVSVSLVDTRIPREQLRTLVTNALLPVSEAEAGARARDWWQRTAQRTQRKVFDEVNKGLVTGESLPDILRRIRGTRERNFEDGAISRREADGIVRTYINGALNESREAVYKENDDVIEAIAHLSTLDARTSHICMARSGAQYRLPNFTPISPTSVPYLGGPPYHFRCRSTMVPILKSFEALVGSKGRAIDRRLKQLPEGTRASIDGQVPASLSFDQWLRRQSGTRQAQLLGRERHTLWTQGRLSLSELIDSATGRPLTVDQLRARVDLVPRETPPQRSRRPSRPWGNVSTEEQRFHNEAFRGASADMRRVVQRTPRLEAITTGDSRHAVSFYNQNAIVMNARLDNDRRAFQSTWRHEYGHHIDFTAPGSNDARNLPASYGKGVTLYREGSRLAGQEIGEAGKAQANRSALRGQTEAAFDARQLRAQQALQSGTLSQVDENISRELQQAFGFTIEEFRQANGYTTGRLQGQRRANNLLAAFDTKDLGYTARALNTELSESGHLQDFFGALTNNNVAFAWGHRSQYYAQFTPVDRRRFGTYSAGNTTEAFANWVDMRGNPNTRVWEKIARAFAPDTTGVFDDILKEVR